MKANFSWRAKEVTTRKSSNWYWAVGILAVGGAVASIIGANVLLALLILIGGFAVMVAGSRPNVEHKYAFSEKGIHVDSTMVAWEKIRKFSMEERRGVRVLVLDTDTLWGTVTMPLSGVDYTEIEMDLKNRNIEKVATLETFAESITRGLGL